MTFHGVKIDYLNLRDAHLSEVRFEDCVIGDLDLSRVRASVVTFPGTRIDQLTTNATQFKRVDLSGARLSALTGLAGLKGTTISSEQLHDLGPSFAAHLGISVTD